jgi:hypothetical protein
MLSLTGQADSGSAYAEDEERAEGIVGIGEEGVGSTYVDNFHVFDHSVRQGKGENYLHLGGGNVSVHCNVVHRIQQPQIWFRVLGVCGNLSEIRL